MASTTKTLDHPVFGRVSGEWRDQAIRHDELLGVGKPLIQDLAGAQALAEQMKDHIEKVVEEIGRFLKGEQVAERARTVIEAILTKSHVLIEGASGTGKTVVVTLAAQVLGFPFERIDALPDLSDLDIIGGEVFEGGEFRLKRSKLLSPIVLMIVDEFGRLSATCANAFLQALEEREVGISDLRGSGDTRLKLSDAFVVAAAMNPQIYGGSGGVNEALFDRISVGLRMPMPNSEVMIEVVDSARIKVGGDEELSFKAQELGLPTDVTLRQIWSAVNQVKIKDRLSKAIVEANYLVSPPEYRRLNGWVTAPFMPEDNATKKLVKQLESESAQHLFEGSNPRGMVLTANRAKANAFFDGRTEVNSEDVRRATQAALLFRLKSYPGTSPAIVSKLIEDAVNLALPKE